ncbi:hypothetical protein BLA29_014540 [Euroglyphus maynei]|uniref:Uncharacterized protein n=1 Tax=Euroglyphus maynei TaxID=6958 RepID=A0A1Y3B158_EURMA|nr:hypothetical protein BLA29_014540 [Euroglyphus maynei]
MKNIFTNLNSLVLTNNNNNENNINITAGITNIQHNTANRIENISHQQQHRDSSSSEHQPSREERSGSRSWAIKLPTMGDIRRLSPPGLKDVSFFFLFLMKLNSF